ncbi:receptor-type tyrosine-protein phosphatase F-like isoform X2 [Clytia hemisphaerica]|uniref:protein-tyrosine-phosphatase n=1 Tax=Clytia hemisphaerica TaxID=252671 RepID=A0A7M5XE13_9CNID
MGKRLHIIFSILYIGLICCVAVQGAAPEITTPSQEKTRLTHKTGDQLQFQCVAESSPTATLKWYLKDKIIDSQQDGLTITSNTIEEQDKNKTTSTLKIETLDLDNRGEYKCEASNADGSVERLYDVAIFDFKLALEASDLSKNSATININNHKFDEKSTHPGYSIELILYSIKSGQTTEIKRQNLGDNPPSWALDSLEAGTQYNVSGQEKVGTFAGDVIGITFTTEEDTPSAPENVIVTEVQSTSFVVAWDTPKMPNGNITNYEVVYKNNGSSTSETSTVSGENSQIMVPNLAPDTVYFIKVQASTLVGSGPYSEQLTVRTPIEMGNLKISTFKTGNDSAQLRLSDHQFAKQSPDYFVVLKLYSIISNVESEVRNLTLNEIASDSLVNLTNLMPYTTYKVTGQENSGEHKVITATTTFTTTQSAPSAPVNIQAKSISANYFIITWEKPLKPNGIIRQYEIRYSFYDGANTVEETVSISDTDTLEKKLDGLYSFVKYTVEIRAQTVDFGPYNSSEVTTLESQPGAPSKVTVEDVNGTNIIVRWEPLPPYQRGGVLTYYKITYKTYQKDENYKTVSPDKSSIELSGLSAYKGYEIKVQALTENHQGKITAVTHKTLEAAPSVPNEITIKMNRQISNNEKGHVAIHTALVSWKEPTDLNGVITAYQIRWWKDAYCVGDDNPCNFTQTDKKRRRRSTLNFRYILVNLTVSNKPKDRERRVTIDGLLAYTKYGFNVQEKTKAGWGPYSKELFGSSSAGNPSKPEILTNYTAAHDAITFSWRSPNRPNGIIGSYSIKLYTIDRLTKELTIIKYFPLNEIHTTSIKDLEAEKRYEIELAAQVNVNNDRLRGDSARFQFTTDVAPAGFPWHYILIACLAVILLIAMVIAIFLLVGRRRDRYEEVRQGDQFDMTAINKSKVIRTSELQAYVGQQLANSDHGIQTEYESVRIPVHSFTWENSQMSGNLSKNRYGNIVAYDHSRVMLNQIDNDPYSTYINANFINGYQQQKKFIAAQGPLPETVLDFWRMVWEQNTATIVMLTRLVEDNKVKCEQYWPEGKALQYGSIVVTVNSVSEMTDYTVRVFTLHKVNSPEMGKREVRQYHYMSWPDHGVPGHPTSMLSFVRHVMGDMKNRRQEGPVVVHCSAGVGRTGTFIAIETGLRQIEHDQTVDIYGTVCRMRMQRNFMVQIEGQYKFIYVSLLDSVICGNTEIEPSELVGKIRYLNLVDPKTGKTNFHEEFKRLETGMTSTDYTHSDAGHTENKQKNRYLNILPYDHNRVKLMPIAGSRSSDYINASMIDGFQQKNAFIATQAPLENTVIDFWRMIQEKNVHTIVMLTKLVERDQDKCYLYWPQAGTVSYGATHVEMENIRQEDENIIVHDLRISNRETGKSWQIKHFMYTGWPDSGSPTTGTEFINLIGSIQRTQLSVQSGGPTLVHCSGGVGRTGVFITVYNTIDKLRSNNVIDIFHTIRQLRLQRVAMCQTLDQYIFCHNALKDYLDSFDLYANPQALAC